MNAKQLVDILLEHGKPYRIVYGNMLITLDVISVYQLDRLTIFINREEYDLYNVRRIFVDVTPLWFICDQINNHIADEISLLPIDQSIIQFSLEYIKESLCL